MNPGRAVLKETKLFLMRKLSVADFALKPRLLPQSEMIAIFLCGALRTPMHSFMHSTVTYCILTVYQASLGAGVV